MAASPLRAALLLVALTATGCNRNSNFDLWPMLTGEPKAKPAVAADQQPQAASQQSADVATAPLAPAGAAMPAPTTNTYVGQKVDQLRSDLQRLQAQLADHQNQLRQIRDDAVQNGQRYYTNVAAINARLQVGTTRGNPNLIQQWNDAQGDLDRINDDVGRLNNLAALIGGDSALASYILESTRAAFSISGAVDEDHRNLTQLEDDTNRATVQVDRLLNDVSDDISRQTAYVNSERRNLTAQSVAINNGELLGGSLANRGFGGQGLVASAAGAPPVSSVARGRPLVVIKFDRPTVSFQQPLYNAVSQALDRRPEATFEIVAVTPNRGNAGQVALASNASRRNAEAVYRALTDMGLAANRVTLSATTSSSAENNEVQVFVR
ncbi:MAG TPA: hypothetical protein VMB81_03210 [Candidatus Sulfotelmatobacter sp.]|nr:hypothetical protein [Candidatus Sulfotelmatobacter sp.]